MSIYRMTLRFNLEDATERQAAEFLKQLDRKEHKSKNRFMIDLIAAHMESLQREKQEDEFVEKLRLMFREEIQDISVAAPTVPQSVNMSVEMTEEEKQENAAEVLAALEMFG